MSSRKRSGMARKNHASNPFNAAIFQIPNLEEIKLADSGSDIDESSLESELETLLSGKLKSKSTDSSQLKKVDVPLDIDKIVSECMKDISDENSDDESSLTDPELLRELSELTCGNSKEEVTEVLDEKNVYLSSIPNEKSSVSNTNNQNPPEDILPMLQERLELYREALSAATGLGDNPKVRRFNRAKKILEEQIKSVKQNKTINIENIPPVVSVPKEKTNNVAESLEKIEDSTLSTTS